MLHFRSGTESTESPTLVINVKPTQIVSLSYEAQKHIDAVTCSCLRKSNLGGISALAAERSHIGLDSQTGLLII